MKQVQITERLFIQLVQYHFRELIAYTEEEVADLESNIQNGLKEKLERISSRTNYTAYKTAETRQEREDALKKYLDDKGVSHKFRW